MMKTRIKMPVPTDLQKCELSDEELRQMFGGKVDNVSNLPSPGVTGPGVGEVAAGNELAGGILVGSSLDLLDGCKGFAATAPIWPVDDSAADRGPVDFGNDGEDAR